MRRYLKENYADPDGTALSDARLTELLADHDATLQNGVSVGSFAYYVGDQIAEAAGLDWAGDDTDTDTSSSTRHQPLMPFGVGAHR